MRLGLVGLPDVGVADVAGKQRSAFVGDLGRKGERGAVDRLEQLLLADYPELLAMAVVGEGLDDIRARMDEVTVELANHVGVLENDLGYVRPRLQIAAALELEQIPLGTDHRALGEALQEAG